MVLSRSSSSKLASLEMQARLITVSMPRIPSATAAVSRIVAFDQPEARMAEWQEVRAEMADVETGDGMAQLEKLRHSKLPT